MEGGISSSSYYVFDAKTFESEILTDEVTEAKDHLPVRGRSKLGLLRNVLSSLLSTRFHQLLLTHHCSAVRPICVS